MAEPWDWTEQDLQAFVDNKATERTDLDFKACAALDVSTPEAREKSRFDLTKDVSAFANSAGGTLVYGIIENRRTHTARKLDRGYDSAEINHEWIGQVINSVQPRIQGVKIQIVQLTKHSPDRVAYVVHVPQSSTAHQAADKRYYKRFNFESVPMEHYEVVDVLSRSIEPVVDIRVSHDDATEGQFDLRPIAEFHHTPALAFHWSSAEGAVAEFAQAQIFISRTVRPGIGPQLECSTKVRLPGGYWDYWFREHRITRADTPLFAGERRFIEESDIGIPSNQDWPIDGHWVPLIVWRVRAGSAPPRAGAVVFRRIMFATWAFRSVDVGYLEGLGYTVEIMP